MSLRLISHASTHVGNVRRRNEDAFVERADIGLWAIADGAGGYGAGDVASAAVVEALSDLPVGLSAAELIAQVRLRMGAVHQDLQCRAVEEQNYIPVSTAVVLLARDEHFACLWAGDSRAYLLRNNNLSRLTHDHSIVQELVDAGVLSQEAAEHHAQANVITRAIGAQGPLELDKVSAKLAPGDALLLCSDGLFKALSDATIEQRLAAGDVSEQLVQAALAAGARDNVTVVTVRVPTATEIDSILTPSAES